MVISLFTNNVIIQTTVFLITSTALLFLTKPFVKKFSHKDTIKTNAYSIIGKNGFVTKEIDNKKGSGQVKIGTETWSAKSTEDENILLGTEIEVVEIDGVKVVVKPVKVMATK